MHLIDQRPDVLERQPDLNIKGDLYRDDRVTHL